MRVSGQTVTIILSDQGRRVLQLAAVTLPESPALLANVRDTDDLGIWINLTREDGEHIFLIRWEYVLSVDLVAGETKTVGLRP